MKRIISTIIALTMIISLVPIVSATTEVPQVEVGKEYVYNFTSDALSDSFDVNAFNATVSGAKGSYDASYFEGLTGFGTSPNVDSAKTTPWSVASTRYVLNAQASAAPHSEITSDGLTLLFFVYRYFDEETPNDYKNNPNDWFMGNCTHAAIVIDVPTAGTYDLGIYNNVSHLYGGYTEVRFGKATGSNIAEGPLTTIYNDENTQTLGWHDSSKVHDGSVENPAENFTVKVSEPGSYVLIFATPNGAYKNNGGLTLNDNGELGMSGWQHQTFNLSRVVLKEKIVPLACSASIPERRMEVGDTVAISANAYMTDGSELPEGVSLVYKSEDESVAEVSEEGMITALKAGETNITVTAKFEDVSSTAKVTVYVREKNTDRYVYNFTSDALSDSFDVDAFNAKVSGAKDSYDASYFEGITGFGTSANVDSVKTTPWSIASMRYVLNATTSGTPHGEITENGIKLLLHPYRYFDEATPNTYKGTGDWFMGWCTHTAIVIDVPTAGTYDLGIYNNISHLYGGHTEVRFGKATGSNIDEFTLTNIYNDPDTQTLGWHDSSKVHDGSEENPAESFFVNVPEAGKHVLIFATPNGTWNKNMLTVADGDVLGMSAYQHQTFNLSKIVLNEVKDDTPEEFDEDVNVSVLSEKNGSVSVSDNLPVVGEVKIGTVITATATANEGYEFAYWRNAAGKVLSVKATESFVINTNTAIIAVYNKIVTPDDETVPVNFFNGNGELIERKETERGKTFGSVKIANPTLTGFSFDSWSISDNQIIDGLINAVALYKDSDTTYTVTVNNTPHATSKKYGDSVVISSSADDFACWKLGEKIISYDKSFELYIYGDIALTEVCGENVSPVPTVVLDEFEGNLFMTYDVPENYVKVEAGILFAKNGTPTVASFHSKASEKSGSGQFTAKPSGTEDTISRAYIIYKDQDGNYGVAYSD